MADPITDTFNVDIKNQEELNIDRDSHILNQRAGALVFDNTTAQERVHLTHRSGANLKLDNKSYSFFSPNTYQGLVHGKSYITVANDSFETTYKSAEKRALGDFTVITGSKGFFNDSIAQEYVDTYRDAAVLKATPEFKIEAVNNNSGAKHTADGSPGSDSDAVEGGSWKKQTATDKTQEVLKEKTKRLTELEMQMGKGGSIKLLAAKHLYLQSGTAAINYDSGIIIPKGREITKEYRVKDKDKGGQEEIKTSTTTYQSVDTSSAMPFGDITLKAMGKFNMEAGSGGLNITTSGNSTIASTGRLSLGGAEVVIGGNSEASQSGRVSIVSTTDVFIKSDVIASVVSPNIVMSADTQILLGTPKVHVTKDVYIDGNLHVHGNVLVNGHIICDKYIEAKDYIHAGNDIVAGAMGGRNISLLNHTHSQPSDSDGDGQSETNRPSKG